MFSSGDSQRDQSPGVPRDAATVILTREVPGGFEVFLLRRHHRQSFMGNAYVFPGGRLDESDQDPALGDCADLDGAEAARRLGEPDLSPARALGLYLAAIRETFEESGVLLARPADGPGPPAADLAARLAPERTRLHDGEITLRDLAATHNLTFNLDGLRPWSHWITPEVEKTRFDTRFFLARIPQGQIPSHDSVETTTSLWVSPQDALNQQQAGNLLLMPPTLKTMDELCRADAIDQLFAHADRRDLRPIMPQLAPLPDQITLLLPHDPDYTLEKLKQEHRPDEISRITLNHDRWLGECYKK